LSVSQGMWTAKSYFYRGNLAVQTEVSSNLTGVHEENLLRDVKGTFTIDLPFDLYNSYLYAPNFKQNLGNLAGKGTYSLPDFKPNIEGSIQGDNYLVDAMSEFADSQRKNSSVPLAYRDELLLVGFADDIQAKAEFKRPHDEYRLTMVVVHLPYTPRIPTLGNQEISRQRISGGFNFEPTSRYGRMRYQGYYTNEENVYLIADGGYIDFTYELAGQISPRSFLHLSLTAFDAQNDWQTITNLVPYMDVFIDYGGAWQPVGLNQTDTALFIPITGAIDESRQVTIRFKAKAEFVLQTPAADWTSS